MDIKQLRYFLQVCGDGSILQASRNLYISQQALSKAISSLEKEIGAPLFYRTSKGLVLTDVGGMLRERSIPIVREMDLLVDQLVTGAQLQGGHVRLGLSIGAVYLLSLESLDRFQQQHPGYTLDITEASYNNCEMLVENGKIDIAVVPGPVHSKALTSIPLADRARVLLLGENHPLAEKREVAVADLEGHPFALCINGRCMEKFNKLCGEHGFSPDVPLRVNETIYMYELCQSRGFLGLSIDYIAGKHLPSYPGLISRPFAGGALSVPIVLAVRKNQKMWPSLKTLVAYIRTVVMETA